MFDNMSEVSGFVRQRRRRSDAERSITAILDAAVDVLNQRPGASVEDVADAAQVTRQTVYAHYPSREALLNAAIDHVTAEAVAAMDAAGLDDEPPTEAFLRLGRAGQRTYERYPRLLQMTPQDPDAERIRHDPVRQRLERVIQRGQDTGEFDRAFSPTWLATVAMALGHAATEEVAAGRMPADDAATTAEQSTLRVLLVTDPQRQLHQNRPPG